jgi:hypothetical protein
MGMSEQEKRLNEQQVREDRKMLLRLCNLTEQEWVFLRQRSPLMSPKEFLRQMLVSACIQSGVCQFDDEEHELYSEFKRQGGL